MKTSVKTLTLSLMAAIALLWTACDNTGSGGINIVVSGLPAGVNADIAVTGPEGYSQMVTGSTELGDLEAGSYLLTINPVDVDGSPYIASDGNGEVTVAVVDQETSDANVEYAFEGTAVGLRGEWYSAGSDVAPLLFQFLGTDSIYANFNADGSYLVESYDTAGVKLTFTGTHTQTPSGTGNIFDIVLNQSTPTAVVSAGILEIYDAPQDSMYYEVVQTDPPLGTAPTAAAGFGSSSGGAFGTSNIQVFRRMQ